METTNRTVIICGHKTMSFRNDVLSFDFRCGNFIEFYAIRCQSAICINFHFEWQKKWWAHRVQIGKKKMKDLKKNKLMIWMRFIKAEKWIRSAEFFFCVCVALPSVNLMIERMKWDLVLEFIWLLFLKMA